MNGTALTLPTAMLALVALACACGRVAIGSDDSGTPNMSTAPQATTGTSPGQDATGTSPPGQDAAGPACRVDADCRLVRDFCAATCGVCRALERSVAQPTCLPPANVRCADVCAGSVAVCQAGRCTVQ
jgi:hypothetical protein